MKWPSGPESTSNAVLYHDIDILMPESTFGELVSSLNRPKFERYRDPEAWNLLLSELVELALWHEDAGTAIGVCRDVNDDKLLALAVTRQTNAIISGGGDLLELVTHEGIPILTPAQLLQRLREPEARVKQRRGRDRPVAFGSELMSVQAVG